MAKKDSSHKHGGGMGTVLILILVTFYTAGLPNLENLHALIHEHHVAENHSAEAEDAPDEYESHVTVEDSCPLCHAAFQVVQILQPTPGVVHPVVHPRFENSPYLPPVFPRDIQSIVPARAPPFGGVIS